MLARQVEEVSHNVTICSLQVIALPRRGKRPRCASAGNRRAHLLDGKLYILRFELLQVMAQQIAAAFAGMAGCMIAIVAVQSMFPRKVNAVHKDKQGNIVDPRTGKPV